jgi:hypothetical protein
VVSVADPYGRDLDFLDRKDLNIAIQNTIHTQTVYKLDLQTYDLTNLVAPAGQEGNVRGQ